MNSETSPARRMWMNTPISFHDTIHGVRQDLLRQQESALRHILVDLGWTPPDVNYTTAQLEAADSRVILIEKVKRLYGVFRKINNLAEKEIE